jgi:two-component system sensor histidine kinase UhpB
LEPLAGGVRLTITDDGIGFDPKLHAPPNGRPAWGLLTMAERAESIGGRLVIDAAPGRGTRVIVKVGNV